MEGTTYGYVRVSTRDQNEMRQLVEMRDLGIEDEFIFIDKQSGKDFKRPAYKRLMRKLHKGDRLIVKSIDRLGRNYTEIIDEWKYITKTKGVDIKILDMPLLDTTRDKDLLGTFISDLVLQLLSFVAENERINIRQRQAEGIEVAKLKGTKFGRPEIEPPEEFMLIMNKWRIGEIRAKDAMQILNMPSTTFYRKVRRYDDTVADG